MKSKYNNFQKILNIKFKNLDFLKMALTHKSYNPKENYEKLEFLGDRVLGLIISKRLIEIYPNEKEGIIDKKLANLVNKKTCSKIAASLNLKKFMFLGKSHKFLERSEEKIMGDCLEALIGAIFLDSKLNNAEKFILGNWDSYLKKSELTLIDAKTRLQEYSLKNYKKLPEYTFYKKTGPQHRPIFKTDVQIPFSKKVNGIGNSKKEAQQDAAAKLLKSLNS